MLDLRLRYKGGGTFQTATRMDYELSERELVGGNLVRAQVSQPRSPRRNAYFHALCEEAFNNQRGGPKLPTWRHLKSHILIECGWCDVKRFKQGSLTPAVARELRKTFETVDFTVDRKTNDILMKTARSIAFDKCSEEEMKDIVDKAVAYICAEIVPGAEPEQIFRMAKEIAA